jgi:hypothetical protein
MGCRAGRQHESPESSRADQSHTQRCWPVPRSSVMCRAMASVSSDAGEARPSRPCRAIRKARARSGEKGLPRIVWVRRRMPELEEKGGRETEK